MRRPRMSSVEAFRRAASHMRTAVLTEDADTRAAIAAKADAIQLWGIAGAIGEGACAVLSVIAGYCIATAIGAWSAQVPGLWDGAVSELRHQAARNAVLGALLAVATVVALRRTREAVAVMVSAVEDA